MTFGQKLLLVLRWNLMALGTTFVLLCFCIEWYGVGVALQVPTIEHVYKK